jgi:Ca2+:H+ antiporter
MEFLNSTIGLALMAFGLIFFVLLAVHCAEVIAHKTGEPYGTLILAGAVTVIEVALIVSMMLSKAANSEFIARDAVFSTIMIVVNGIVGISIIAASLKKNVLSFQSDGVKGAFGVLIGLSISIFIFPSLTQGGGDLSFSSKQLSFMGITSLVLYVSFLLFQTVSHKAFFIDSEVEEEHHDIPSNKKVLINALILPVALVLVVVLAKKLSPFIETEIANAGLPTSVVGVIIALLVLLPEGITAIKAAYNNNLQKSLNLGLGSALASIGLTIPVLSVLVIMLDLPLSLGLDPLNRVILLMTLILGGLTLSTGRVTRLQGIIHLIIFLEFLFLTIEP